MVSNVIKIRPTIQIGLASFLLKTLAMAVTFEGSGVGGTLLVPVVTKAQASLVVPGLVATTAAFLVVRETQEE